MEVLLDINVILDVFLARSAWLADSAAVVQAGLDGRITTSLSAAAVPTLFYIVRKNADLARAHAVVGECLKTFSILPVERATLELAATFSGPDYEDNLQIACAVQAALDAIVTRDPGGFAGSPVPILSPAEFLTRLSKRDDAGS